MIAALTIACGAALAGNPDALQPNIDRIDLDAILGEMDRANEVKVNPKILAETYVDEFGGVFMSSVNVLPGVKEAMDETFNDAATKKEHVMVRVAKAPFRLAGAVVSGIVETTVKAVDSSFTAMKEHPRTTLLSLFTAWLIYDSNKSSGGDGGGTVSVATTAAAEATTKTSDSATAPSTTTIINNFAGGTVNNIIGNSNQDKETSTP